MVAVDERMGTVYLNAAVVPRVAGAGGSQGGGADATAATKRHFVRVTLEGPHVERVENVWMTVEESAVVGEEAECILEMTGASQYRVYKAHTNEWVDVAFNSLHESLTE